MHVTPVGVPGVVAALELAAGATHELYPYAEVDPPAQLKHPAPSYDVIKIGT